MERKPLLGLKPQTYEHPLDRKTLDSLQKTGGLETLVRKVNEWGLERMLQVQLSGSHLKATEDSFPELAGLLREAAHNIDLPTLPDLYVAAQGGLNAFTAGVKRPIIVISSEAVDCLTPDELLFVIGHEVGHIKSGHVLYYQIAEYLPVIGEILGGVTLGLGELAGAGLQVALLNWKRMSEFSADRAGLLACQDANPALTVMMKAAGLPRSRYDSANTEDFIAQARSFESLDADALNWIARRLSVMGQTHPWTVLRAQQMLAWIDDGSYEQVLSASHEGARPMLGSAFCVSCGFKLGASDTFCAGCGARLRAGS
ncbi:MAG: protease [Betaproteobacteria bacterium]|jgi:Zn-dependent protease with chaperone function|nr:MAG: protease [Betaproteobacteria bacterium]TMH36816.1 MAG: protease [Betaproteobacteria bacterium]